MVAVAAPLAICILSFVLIRSIHMDRFGPPPTSLDQHPDYIQNQIEDEIEYAPLATPDEEPIYDWSPPNGELPNNDFKIADPLSAYLGDGDDIGRSLDVRESWIDQVNGVLGDSSKTVLKRAFDLPRRKKNQVLCRVQREIHHHSEAGYEFFPKSYTSYSCNPVSPAQAQVVGSSTNHDTCFVTGNNCITIEKEQLFLKRRHNTNCWTHFIEAVGAGCKCLSRKY